MSFIIDITETHRINVGRGNTRSDPSYSRKRCNREELA